MEQEFEERLVAIADAARMLAVGKPTVYRLIASGRPTVVYVTPDTPRIKWSSVKRLIGDGCEQSAAARALLQ